MNIPTDRVYCESHEWVKIVDGVAVIGITDYAQEQLGDITYVDLMGVGDVLETEQDCAVIESVKAASDIFSPIAGTVAAVNEDLEDAPELVNTDANEAGWLFRLSDFDQAEVDALMSAEAYVALVNPSA